jgi:hypothetical protein
MKKNILLVVIGIAIGYGFQFIINRNDVVQTGHSVQFKNYLWWIDSSRHVPADDLVGTTLTTQEYQSKYCVVFADEKCISYRADQFSYSGGAHGSNEIKIGTIDRKTGDRVRLAEFVSADKLPKLTEMLYAKVAEKLGGKEHIQDEVRPIENFCVVKDGLKFVYNEYEVACYAAGAVEVLVKWEEIESLCRGENILKEVTKK